MMQEISQEPKEGIDDELSNGIKSEFQLLSYKHMKIRNKNSLHVLILTVVVAIGLFGSFADPHSYVKPCQFQKEITSPQKYQVPIDIPIADRTLKHEPHFEHHDMQQATFSYPTVGIPIPGRTFNFTKVPQQKKVEFDSIFLDYYQPYNDTDCKYARYGDRFEGGYVTCQNFWDKSEGFINLGIEGRDTLGCDITAKHRMPNYQYDCTNPYAPKCHQNKGMNKFYHSCVGQKTETNGQYTYLTLQDMLKRHNLTGKHWSLKIDIQGGQIQAFKYFPVEELKYLDSIIMEVHMGPIQDQEWGILDVHKTISQHFVVVNYHESNGACRQAKSTRRLRSPAIETALVNKRLIKINKPTRSFCSTPPQHQKLTHKRLLSMINAQVLIINLSINLDHKTQSQTQPQHLIINIYQTNKNIQQFI